MRLILIVLLDERRREMTIEFSTWIEVEDQETEEKTIEKAWEEFEKSVKEDGVAIFSAFDPDTGKEI